MQSKPIKPKRCISCKELFTPKRIGLKLTKSCSPECEGKIERKVKPKKTKLKTAAQLKKELWKIFSLHQKLVHSSDGEWCKCYTCDKPLRIGDSDTHGGHCLSKAANPALYFDERAVRPQCLRCNVHHGGMHYEFNERLKQEIGVDSWSDMYENRKNLVKRSADWYLSQIEYYKEQNKIIKSEKCKDL